MAALSKTHSQWHFSGSNAMCQVQTGHRNVLCCPCLIEIVPVASRSPGKTTQELKIPIRGTLPLTGSTESDPGRMRCRERSGKYRYFPVTFTQIKENWHIQSSSACPTGEIPGGTRVCAARSSKSPAWEHRNCRRGGPDGSESASCAEPVAQPR